MRIITEARVNSVQERRLEFDVHEYLETDDGRMLPLADDRGWSVGGQGVEGISLRSVLRDIENVVLPDDAESTGETRTWDRYLVSLRERHGIELSADELRGADLEFRVSVSSRLRSRLGDD